MISKNEILAYLGITLLFFLAISIAAFISQDPDLSIPERNEPVETTPTTTKPTETTSQGPTRTAGPISPPEPSPLPNILFVLMGLIGLAFLIFIIASIRRASLFSATVRSEKIKTEEEGVHKLKNARDEAYLILKKSLEVGNYTESFIKAYQVLDKNLDYFREIARPKHYTPREYSFSVREPIFRPSVYSFVKIFYDLRYGSSHAEMENIHTFITALDNLFASDILEIYREEMWNDFNDELKGYKEFTIPATFDPTKPTGRRL